jgi:phosphoglycerol transferase MdoB-like AlkP superfamily enzyme
MNPQLNPDQEHLRLLAIFHYVLAGITGLFSLFPVFHLLMGLALALRPDQFGFNGPLPPAWFGWLFVVFAAAMILMGLTLAGLVLFTARCLSQRRRHLFCLVMAGVECIFVPIGTVLGVFTLIVLVRPTVKELFATAASAAPQPNLASPGDRAR